MSDVEEEPSVSVEQCVFHEENVFFYQIPRHASTSDPRAEAWNPDSPLLTGSVKVIQKGDDCFVRLFEPPKDGEGKETTLFAQCPVVIDSERNLTVHVQDCADSSRYFVIRVEDEVSKRHAFIGIGFPERPSAFNFKATLQDYVRYRQRQMEVQTVEIRSKPPIDYSLHEGQVIHVNLKKGKEPINKRKLSNSNKGFKLAPPPQDQDDWGDFK